MPDATAQISPSIAQFLAIGAPAAPVAAEKGAFAAVLAQQAGEAAAAPAKQAGKILPGERQDPAIRVSPAIAGDAMRDGETEKDADADTEAFSDDATDATPEPAAPKPMVPVIALLPQPRPEAAPVIFKPTVLAEAQVRPDRPAPDAKPRAEAPAPAPSVPVRPIVMPLPVTAREGIPGFGKAEAAAGHVDPIRIAPDPAIAPARNPFPEKPAPVAPLPVAQTVAAMAADAAPAPDVQPVAKPELPIVDKTPVQSRRAAPVLPAPQPADARSVAFVMRADPAAEPVSLKPRQRAAASSGEPAIAAGTQPADIRTVTAATAAAPADALGADRVNALIETIEALRSEAADNGRLDIAIDHEDFGPLSIRFEHAGDGVVVQFDTRDADLARLIADAAPDLKAAGDPLGMRFERRDSLGANAGGSGDASRRSREPGRTETDDSRPQPRQRRGRSGIFA